MDSNAEKKYLDLIEEKIAQGPFEPTWESLAKARVPEWLNDRRLGIFMHWGVYSVPAAFNEWYSRNMYRQGDEAFDYHRKTYGPQDRFGYKDFIPMFRAENFDPDEWISVFKEAGAGYIFPVAEHHDGFQMYESELSDWNAKNMGPKRDVVAELKEAAKKQDITFCTSTHRAEHWFFMGVGKDFESDIKEPLKKGDLYWPSMPEGNFEDIYSEPAPTEEYLNDWMARCAELVIKYRPALLYFDWWIQHTAFKPYLKKLAAFYYNCGVEWGQDVMFCYKHDALAFGSGLVEMERGGFSEAMPFRWQTDTAVARNSWCYTDSLIYKTGNEIICTLADTVAKNGNLLLNIGPKADGTLPEGDLKILKELGEWMKVNSEAVNGTYAWRIACEGPTQSGGGMFSDGEETVFTSDDYRFTAKGDSVYAICMKCPEDGKFTIKSLRDSLEGSKRISHIPIRDVTILGYDRPVTFKTDEEALHVHAPGIESGFPVTIRVRTV